MSNEKFSTNVTHEDIKALRENPYIADNRRAYWNDELEQDLKDLFLEGRGFSEIAVLLQRTENSIIRKVKELDLEKPVYQKRPKAADDKNNEEVVKLFAECLCTECKNRTRCNNRISD